MVAKIPLDYRSAGVDIDAGSQLVERIKPLARSTFRSGVLGGLGGFGGLFELPAGNYSQPVLIAGSDGVGTKLKLALDVGKHDTVGIDLVAMCANDIVVSGAEPLFFLDYYATGKLDVDTAAEVVAGIAEGCRQAGMALLGGETAEMPGMYQGNDYDLAGFCVGVAEKSRIIDGSQVRPGDALIALASSGTHSNGYSLIRKILDQGEHELQQSFINQSLGETLLTPTRIYVKPILELRKTIEIHAISHITGGGLTENLPRVLPPDTQAIIELGSWRRPPIFDWLQREGAVVEQEMLCTFNCGVGMVLCVAAKDLTATCEHLSAMGETVWKLGEVVASEGEAKVEYQT